MQFQIGIIADWLGLPLDKALAKCAALGADGVQLYAVGGEMAPENMTPASLQEKRALLKDNGLTVSALCGDLGGHGFARAAENPAKIEKSKRIVDLALELGSRVVTTHIGVVPADPAHPRYAVMQDACGQLAAYADSLRAHFAIETGPELSAVLKTFLDTLHSTGVAVNLDPANLVMVAGDDPVKAVHNLKEYIVHTHAKDGRMLRRVNPETIYNGTLDFAEAPFIELPLGQGDVDFPAYLSALNDIGYTGYLTIEREVGDDPEGDIRLAVNFLQSLIR